MWPIPAASGSGAGGGTAGPSRQLRSRSSACTMSASDTAARFCSSVAPRSPSSHSRHRDPDSHFAPPSQHPRWRSCGTNHNAPYREEPETASCERWKDYPEAGSAHRRPADSSRARQSEGRCRRDEAQSQSQPRLPAPASLASPLCRAPPSQRGDLVA